MKKLMSLLLLLSVVFVGYSQGLVDIRNTGTCEEALDITRFKRFGPTTTPAKSVEGNKQNFEYTKHPTWYKFTVPRNGILLFDIIPEKQSDNYDFLLFKANENFCEQHSAGNIKAIRTNLQPPTSADKGQTGLSITAKVPSYEKGVEVKQGEIFYLALNNMYENGKGHTVLLRFLETRNITGNVTQSKKSNPIKATIMWENLRNSDMKQVIKTSKKGEYAMNIPLSSRANYFPKYQLTAYADKYIPEIKTYSTQEAKKFVDKEIDFKLSKIKKGLNNENLGVIYFMPNEDNMEVASEIVFRKIFILLSTNPRAEITLHGHTNGLYPSTDVDTELSERRATVIKQELVNKGIGANRIKIQGFGSLKEVYPNPENEEQEGFNRRVEVFFDKF